jgi:clan AA aspartic protease (TIGR02281 family)
MDSNLPSRDGDRMTAPPPTCPHCRGNLQDAENDWSRFQAGANGMVRGASIVVEDPQVGGLHLTAVRASVNETAMDESLLGMTFFNRLRRYAVENDVLTIEWAAQ